MAGYHGGVAVNPNLSVVIGKPFVRQVARPDISEYRHLVVFGSDAGNGSHIIGQNAIQSGCVISESAILRVLPFEGTDLCGQTISF